MARIRSIKPELRTSLTAAEWPREIRYFWTLLWGYLDDHGRGVDEPRLIKADCFPLDDDLTAADIDKWLDLMATPRDDDPAAICRYTVGGRRFVHAPRWGDHQKPQHPKDTKIPACQREDCGRGSPDLHEDVMKPHESLSGNGVSNTPSPSPVRNGGKGEMEMEAGDGDGGVAPAKPLRDDVERLCAHLADRIEANGSKRPTVTQKWRDSARLMLDSDGRTEKQIHDAIDWCQASEFWRSNVMSMPKLRDQYERLRLQASRDRGAGANDPQSAADHRRSEVARLRELDRQQREGASPRNVIQGSVIGDQ
ncbi:MAG: hypothetical protein J2P30_00355 [Actinobacteria bacterium]|nr:hypothetical protein [Actinomycetota bacterium]